MNIYDTILWCYWGWLWLLARSLSLVVHALLCSCLLFVDNSGCSGSVNLDGWTLWLNISVHKICTKVHIKTKILPSKWKELNRSKNFFFYLAKQQTNTIRCVALLIYCFFYLFIFLLSIPHPHCTDVGTIELE